MSNKLNICFFGTGYVGLVSGTCFAKLGHYVTCADTDSEKISQLKLKKIPIYEPELTELVEQNFDSGRLKFAINSEIDLREFDIAVIAVGTPNKQDGSTNLTFVDEVVKFIKKQKHKNLTVMVKSTVPLGTCRIIYDELNKNSQYKIDVVSNPEFLREGNAVKDFLKPERIILGYFEKETKRKLGNLYQPFNKICKNIIHTDCQTSELIKYASNAFLSTKVAFINEIANICEKIDADINMIAYGMGLDSRIGSKFLNPGPGFGGSCFPKDIQALNKITDKLNTNNKLIAAVEISNNQWKLAVSKKILNYLQKIGSKKLTIWGVTYKANTDDIRSSPVIDIIKFLLAKNIIINCYDPMGLQSLKTIFGKEINYYSNIYASTQGSDLIVIATEWSEFKEVNFSKLKKGSKTIFDLRNILNDKAAKKAGFTIYKLGKKDKL